MHRIWMVCLSLYLSMGIPVQAGSLVVQVAKTNQEPLPDAVVYLLADNIPAAAVNSHIEIEQKDKMFKPFVTVLPVGANAIFPNRDGIGHHVYSFSPAKNFQLPLSEHESTDTITFDQTGVVTVGCNIHDWMVGYIYVVATPYYAKSGADGAAVIENVPAGDYEIHIVHPGMKSEAGIHRRLTITADNQVRQDFSLEIKPEYLWRPAPQSDEETY